MAALPGGERLLACAGEGVHLVGGSLRDLILRREPRELDVVVEGPIEPLLASLGGEQLRHQRFQTATVRLDGAQIDVAMARSEHYARPGALPSVEPASLAEDLRRRDFTLNAIAMSLAGERRGQLHAVEHAWRDLAEGLLRVLHDRSFRDDPTRLLRLARYAARLGFNAESRTAQLAAEALAAGSLRSLSRARIGGELRLALSFEPPLAMIAALADLGLLTALGIERPPTEQRLRRALALLPADGRRELLLALALLSGAGCASAVADQVADGSVDGPPATAPAPAREARLRLHRLLAALECTAAECASLERAQETLPGLGGRIAEPMSASGLYALLAGLPVEAIAWAAAGADQRSRPAALSAARRWLGELRLVRLRISGADLLAAGVAEGPLLGRLLHETLMQRLDRALPAGGEAELAWALQRHRELSGEGAGRRGERAARRRAGEPGGSRPEGSDG